METQKAIRQKYNGPNGMKKIMPTNSEKWLSDKHGLRSIGGNGFCTDVGKIVLPGHKQGSWVNQKAHSRSEFGMWEGGTFDTNSTLD